MTLRLAIVGHGRWGRNIEQTLLTLPDITLSIIGRGERPPTALDGVIVATQSASHAEIALPYIEAGIATFIEKPMATTRADAGRIRDAAARSGSIVFVGHILLYNPAVIAALEILPSLGPVRHLLCEGMNDRPRADSSVLWDWLPHHLSVALAIFGREPTAVGARSLAGNALSEAADAEFDFGDAAVTSRISWRSQVQRRHITIACADATLVLDDLSDRRIALHDKDGRITYPPYASDLPLTRELAAFASAIRSGEPDPRQVQFGVSIACAIAAAEESILLGGKPVAIPHGV